MIKVIPAIDLIDGKCVRLTQGNYDTTKVYNEDPLSVAQEFESNGVKNLHLVDLDGARSGNIVNLRILEKICSNTTLKVDFGGGISSLEDVENLLQAGADRVNIGSMAIKDPELTLKLLSKFNDKIILSADVKNNLVAINGWQFKTETNIFDHIQNYVDKGLKAATCTDISTDGMLNGPNFSLYRDLKKRFWHTEIIASGGVHRISDVYELEFLGVDGVIVGKAIYEGLISIEDLKLMTENA